MLFGCPGLLKGALRQSIPSAGPTGAIEWLYERGGPEWMINAIITWPYRKAAENGGGVTTELVEDKPGPIDVLTPGKVKKVLKGMQQFFRTVAHRREFGSHYDVLRQLTLSLWRGIGDEKLFEMCCRTGMASPTGLT